MGRIEQVSCRKNGEASEREGGSRQEKWDQKFGPRNIKTTRVYFSSNGMLVYSLAEVDLDRQVKEFELSGILV